MFNEFVDTYLASITKKETKKENKLCECEVYDLVKYPRAIILWHPRLRRIAYGPDFPLLEGFVTPKSSVGGLSHEIHSHLSIIGCHLQYNKYDRPLIRRLMDSVESQWGGDYWKHPFFM